MKEKFVNEIEHGECSLIQEFEKMKEYNDTRQDVLEHFRRAFIFIQQIVKDYGLVLFSPRKLKEVIETEERKEKQKEHEKASLWKCTRRDCQQF